MRGSKLDLLMALFALIALLFTAPPAFAQQEDELVDKRSEQPLEDESGLFNPPPGDPCYDPQSPQARTPRPSAGDALVSKARIIPHWIHQGKRFWYRNDSGKGKREFILVDAEKGTREAAFDHEKLARALSRATRNAYI